MVMKPAIDRVTGIRLYHIPCGRALWEMTSMGGPMVYLWCDKCQTELGYNSSGVTMGRETARRIREVK